MVNFVPLITKFIMQKSIRLVSGLYLKLSLLTVPTAQVIRNGGQTEIHAKDIVLDDIVCLSLGNQIPADCIVAEGSVEVNEALLTGESVPVKKEVGDFLYAGSFISSGSCKARADKVGKNTYLNSLSAKAKKHPWGAFLCC